MLDPFNLQRFIDAQSEDYENARSQLRAGRKTSHWIWFIFPQIAAADNKVFIDALNKYFSGEFDPLTLARL